MEAEISIRQDEARQGKLDMRQVITTSNSLILPPVPGSLARFIAYVQR